MDYINKGSTFSKRILDKIIPIIVFYVLIKLIFAYITAIISYKTWIDWWNKTGGSEYKSTFDIYSMACFNSSNLLFKTRQLFIPGSASLNETDILLLQSIVLNNANIVPTEINQQNFVTPRHVCEGIAWGNGDLLIFQQAIDYWYSGDNNTQKSNWYAKWNDPKVGNRCGPDDGDTWTTITGNTCGGFWPHQNGCFGFFDVTGGGNRYDLNANKAKSKNINQTSSNMYNPGNNDPLSSWAQLFADFGIVYSQATSGATTVVPIVDGSSKPTLWYESGQKTLDTGYTYGPNFLGLYYINPSSYVLTSWVSGLYDDPTTGIIFDTQAIKNLIGMNPGASKSTTGGWVKFLKGFNTNITSYDAIMNDLFATYATNYTSKPDPNKDTACSTTSKASKWFGNIISVLSIALFLIPGVGPELGAGAEAAAVAAREAAVIAAKKASAKYIIGAVVVGTAQSALQNKADCGSVI